MDKLDKFEWDDYPNIGIIAQELSQSALPSLTQDELDKLLANTYTITTSSSWLSSGNNNISIGNSGSYVIGGASGPHWGNTVSSFSNNNPNPAMTVNGDLIVKGKNIVNILDKIQDRLAILDDPSPEKLEKHAALKKAYDNYKLLEKLIGEE
jgi:hypothetical protein